MLLCLLFPHVFYVINESDQVFSDTDGENDDDDLSFISVKLITWII